MKNIGFKLLAIMPLDGCDTKYLKILREEQPYYFYSNYKIEKDIVGVESVIVTEDKVPRIFDIGDLKINVTAIVGKNGSGKSSLIELLYVVFYNISKQQRILPKKDEEGEIYKMEEGVRVAIYFAIDDGIFKLEQSGRNNTLYEFNDTYVDYKQISRLDKKKNINFLFYNIVVNYSHYALNVIDAGHWLKSIFHKNDAYQTPIVLNPYRENGVIDINRENYLVRSRLLVNILEKMNGVFSFGKREKTPTYFYFSLDHSKFRLRKNTQQVVLERTHSVKRFVIPTIYEFFFGDAEFKPTPSPLNDYAKEYIIGKLYSIVTKYKHYFKYRGFSTQKANTRLVNYLKALSEDTSHITFKLKQALNFLRFDIIDKTSESIKMEIEMVKYNIAEVKEKYDIPTIELMPPAFLSFDIEFSDQDDHFSRFSSGEKQKIYAYSSLIYHLKNLDSILLNTVERDKPSDILLRYSNINVIFDEIELYYHPDLQRRFINDLLNSIRGANLKLINSINFIFITHSPFVLSDIPCEHTLYLDVVDKKALQRYPQSNTFGGNIHDLLANNFFLDEDGYIGENAKEILTEVYKYLEFVIMAQGKYKGEEKVDGWTKAKVRKVIDMTGERLIQSSLNELYSQAFLRNKSEIDMEIERLQNLREGLS